MPDLAYTCPCGVRHAAGVWGAAHWSEILTHTCPDCGRVNTIENGHVLRTLRPQPDGRPTRLDRDMAQKPLMRGLSDAGFVLVTEMVANDELNSDAIIEHVRREES